MKAQELYSALCEAIPTSLSCEWDRDGLESCPDPEKEVKRVLIALDVTDTDAVISAVREAGYKITMEPTDIVIPSSEPCPARIAFFIGPLGEEIEIFQRK